MNITFRFYFLIDCKTIFDSINANKRQHRLSFEHDFSNVRTVDRRNRTFNKASIFFSKQRWLLSGSLSIYIFKIKLSKAQLNNIVYQYL